MMAPKMARTIPMIQPVSQLLLLALVPPVGEGREGGREKEREGGGREGGRERGGEVEIKHQNITNTSEMLNLEHIPSFSHFPSS